MSHTPGPWTVEQDVVNNGDILIMTPEFRPLAEVDVRQSPEDTDGIPREIALANARLIAAAPELLEACKAQHDAIDLLFAMLIQATPDFFPSKSGQPWQAMIQGNAAIQKAEGA
jgi:hypothetical protein